MIVTLNNNTEQGSYPSITIPAHGSISKALTEFDGYKDSWSGLYGRLWDYDFLYYNCGGMIPCDYKHGYIAVGVIGVMDNFCSEIAFQTISNGYLIFDTSPLIGKIIRSAKLIVRCSFKYIEHTSNIRGVDSNIFLTDAINIIGYDYETTFCEALDNLNTMLKSTPTKFSGDYLMSSIPDNEYFEFDINQAGLAKMNNSEYFAFCMMQENVYNNITTGVEVHFPWYRWCIGISSLIVFNTPTSEEIGKYPIYLEVEYSDVPTETIGGNSRMVIELERDSKIFFKKVSR